MANNIIMSAQCNGNTSNEKVQQVKKASSDELLRKFAQVVSETELKMELKLANKRRRNFSKNRASSGSEYSSPTNRRASLDQCTSLLPRRQRRVNGRSRLNNFKSKSILGTIHKTWRRTVEGASKVFLKKHYYNRHKRLVNDPVY